MSRTKGHNLYIVNLFISWVDKLKCYRILIHTPKARVSNGWENVLESWYTHPRQGFPICGKMCLNLDTPTQDEGFQCVGKCAWILIHPSKTRVSNGWENVFESWYTHPRPGFPMGGKICLNLDAPIQGRFQWTGKCDWILIHPPNARVSNGWENVLEFWYTYTRAGFPMEGKMCLNLDTPTLTLTQGFLWLLSLFMLFNFVCGLFGSNERIAVDYLLFDYICIAFLLPWGEPGSLYE